MKLLNLPMAATATVISLISITMSSTATNAQEIVGFQTPSGNIHCLLFNNNLRCELKNNTSRLPNKPKNCDLDWGNAFGMRVNGKAARLCHGDTVQNPDYPVLGYGKTVRKNGFRCTSRRTGLTCVNSKQNGWFLSRERQRIF